MLGIPLNISVSIRQRKGFGSGEQCVPIDMFNAESSPAFAMSIRFCQRKTFKTWVVSTGYGHC